MKNALENLEKTFAFQELVHISWEREIVSHYLGKKGGCEEIFRKSQLHDCLREYNMRFREETCKIFFFLNWCVKWGQWEVRDYIIIKVWLPNPTGPGIEIEATLMLKKTWTLGLG